MSLRVKNIPNGLRVSMDRSNTLGCCKVSQIDIPSIQAIQTRKLFHQNESEGTFKLSCWDGLIQIGY